MPGWQNRVQVFLFNLIFLQIWTLILRKVPGRWVGVCIWNSHPELWPTNPSPFFLPHILLEIWIENVCLCNLWGRHRTGPSCMPHKPNLGPASRSTFLPPNCRSMDWWSRSALDYCWSPRWFFQVHCELRDRDFLQTPNAPKMDSTASTCSSARPAHKKQLH